MTDNNTQDIRHKIEESISSREKKAEMIEQGRVVSEQLPNAHRMMGHDSRAAALFYFHLGECTKGIVEFQRAATHYQSTVRIAHENSDEITEGRSVDLRYLLHSTLLSNDDDLLKQAAELTLSMSSGDVDSDSEIPYFYYYVMALAAEITDTGNQCTYLNKLYVAIENIQPEYTKGNPTALYDACYHTLLGVIENSTEQISNGMAALLDYHADSVPANSTQPKHLVCMSAAALFVLAHRNGLNVQVDSEYVPGCVYEVI